MRALTSPKDKSTDRLIISWYYWEREEGGPWLEEVGHWGCGVPLNGIVSL
jgi:hypothetical protein